MKLDNAFMEFDVIGIDPSLINAFRRILISEVPTMAIEKVYISSNTSPLQDEILAHRLGLVPLKANARLFQRRLEGDSEGTDRDTLHFQLKIKCIKNVHVRYGHYRPEDLYINYEVFSSNIRWIPIGEQKNLYKESDIGPVYDDIMVAKLRPGLEIDVRMEAVKGIGRDHAKFSPVGTASYRLHPYINLLKDIEGEQADLLQSCFSPGVIGITHTDKAYVINARDDSCSRNIYLHEELNDKVVIGKLKDHYICK
ncbi:hypothetical protein AAG570_013145 [Ranatra chinensis]|uniref:DNA-directed RNA polymerases I and III subunit RPAC1 n=1 Tax=Ranatra chinensis TaxID=642074 RepID=A0ABD0YUI1_9HEMI